MAAVVLGSMRQSENERNLDSWQSNDDLRGAVSLLVCFAKLVQFMLFVESLDDSKSCLQGEIA
jgi:hypothetical protein